MKKFIVIAAMLLVCLTSEAQTFKKEGKNYSPVTLGNTRVPKDSIITEFTWKDLPIVVRKADGYAWVCRYSTATGKFRREILPEEVAKDVCQQIGIKYTHVKKTKTTTKK